MRSMLSEAEKNEIKNIDKRGFTRVMNDILAMQDKHGQINIELLEMFNRSTEALKQLAKEHTETLKELLDKRGIAYRGLPQIT